MNGWTLAAFVFLVGVTVAGLSGSILEVVTGTQPRFAEPFVSRRRLALSLLATLFAGPIMLGNDALAARREARAGIATIALAAVFIAFWCCSTGVVVVELLWQVTRPLG